MDTERFRRIFAKLPESEKKLSVVKIEDNIYSWEESYKEIVNNTAIGEKIYKKLIEEEII